MLNSDGALSLSDIAEWSPTKLFFRNNKKGKHVMMPRCGLILSQNESYSIQDNFPTYFDPIWIHIEFGNANLDVFGMNFSFPLANLLDHLRWRVRHLSGRDAVVPKLFCVYLASKS